MIRVRTARTETCLHFKWRVASRKTDNKLREDRQMGSSVCRRETGVVRMKYRTLDYGKDRNDFHLNCAVGTLMENNVRSGGM